MGAPPRALVLVVGGDSLTALAMQLEGRSSPRPLTLDLLWKVLPHGIPLAPLVEGCILGLAAEDQFAASYA